jgi:hypothetical protein
MMENRRQYIADLVSRGAVKIDEDDPAFELVILNRLILEDKASEFEQLFGDFKQKVSSDVEKLEHFTQSLPASIKEAVTPSLATVAVAAEKVSRSVQEAAHHENAQKQALHQLMQEFQKTIDASHKQLNGISIIANDLSGLKKNLTWLILLLTSTAFIIGTLGGFFVSKFS